MNQTQENVTKTENEKSPISQSSAELPSQTELVNIGTEMLNATDRIRTDSQWLLEFIDKQERFQELTHDINIMIEAAEQLSSLIIALFFNKKGQFYLKSFTSSKRHDLRTPINVIIGYGEMSLEEIGEEVDEPAQSEMGAKLQNILTLGRRLLTLIGNLCALLNEHLPVEPSQRPLLLTVYEERCVLQRRLSKLGFSVEVAENGLDILHKIRHQTFYLVLNQSK